MKLRPLSISCGPVIIENGKVLLNREQHEDSLNTKASDFLLFPGGRMDVTDNSPEDTCKREAMEELGIDVHILKQLRTIVQPSIAQPDEKVVLIHFLAERIGDITPGKQTLEWGWYDINNLPDNCADNVKMIIDDIKKEL